MKVSPKNLIDSFKISDKTLKLNDELFEISHRLLEKNELLNKCNGEVMDLFHDLLGDYIELVYSANLDAGKKTECEDKIQKYLDTCKDIMARYFKKDDTSEE